MPIFIQCTSCRKEQLSQTIQMTSKDTFEAMKGKMEAMNETCKICGAAIEVSSRTAHWLNDRIAP